MSTPVLLSVAWAITATVVALMPMRLQFPPGILLLLAAPVLIVWLGAAHGWLWSLAGLAAFVSMFRRPLRHFWSKMRGVSTGGPQA